MPTLEQDVEEFERMFDVSSIAARSAEPVTSVYSASEAAMDALTINWAVEFDPYGIRVNSVAPDLIRTDMLKATSATHSNPWWRRLR